MPRRERRSEYVRSERRRESNRRAAQKFREKHKQSIEQLDNTVSELKRTLECRDRGIDGRVKYLGDQRRRVCLLQKQNMVMCERINDSRVQQPICDSKQQRPTSFEWNATSFSPHNRQESPFLCLLSPTKDGQRLDVFAITPSLKDPGAKFFEPEEPLPPLEHYLHFPSSRQEQSSQELRYIQL